MSGDVALTEAEWVAMTATFAANGAGPNTANGCAVCVAPAIERIVADRLAAERERIAEILVLHTGFHRCGSDYYTDGADYQGSIAKVGSCPTARIARGTA